MQCCYERRVLVKRLFFQLKFPECVRLYLTNFLVIWYNYGYRKLNLGGSGMKKKLVLIAIIMNLVLLPLISHADTITSESKAAALNKLTILQGNGVDFNLSGQ